MNTTTQIPAPTITDFGFFGAMGEHAEAAWPIAMAAISDATCQPLESVRTFLDSRHGRHFADDVQNSLYAGANLADATPWAAEGLEVDDADPDAARQILTDAGWRDEDGDGFLDDAQLTLFYPADDSLRRGLALNVADQAKDAGIEIEPKGASWEVIEERMHDDAVVFGWGSLDPTEIYNLYHSEEGGQGFNNPGGYANPQVDEHLDAAVQTADPDRARGQWQQAQQAAAEDVPWIWLVNLEHTYYIADCLDVGTPQVEPHGHGWPITAGIADWTWTC